MQVAAKIVVLAALMAIGAQFTKAQAGNYSVSAGNGTLTYTVNVATSSCPLGYPPQGMTQTITVTTFGNFAFNGALLSGGVAYISVPNPNPGYCPTSGWQSSIPLVMGGSNYTVYFTPSTNGSGLAYLDALMLTASPNPGVAGSAVQFQATQQYPGATGTVTFANGSTNLGSATLSSNVASLNVSTLAAGSYTITASYSGSLPSSSTTLAFTVIQGISISVTSSGTPSTYGSPVTFTAAVPAGDTNTVTFYSGGTSIGTATPSNGTATLTTSSLAVGSNSISATIAAGGNYGSATSSAITQTVNKATPTVSVWPTAGAITFGQSLASSTLGSGTASVGGTFAWTTSSTAPAAGTPSESVTFTPTSTANYNTVTGAISVTVHQAPLTVTAGSPSVSYGAAVPIITPTYSGWQNGNTASSLTTAPTCSTTYTTTSAPGSYASSCSGAVDPNYTFTYVAGTVTVSKATPTVSVWPTAGAITFGQTLASSTLGSGTASVGGTFGWTTSSIAPPAGTPTESVTFTPTSTTTYNTVTSAIGVTVHQAALTVTAGSPSVSYGAAVPAITPAYNGWQNGNTTSSLTTAPTCSTTYTTTSAPGSYTSSCSGAVDPNYTFSYVAGTVTVSKATPTISISDIPSSASFGGSFTAIYSYSGNGSPTLSSSTSSVCTVSVATVSYVGVGTCTLTASAPATTDYTAVTGGAQSFTVSKAGLTVTASGASVSYGAAVPSITPTYSGWKNGNTVSSLTTAATCSTTYITTSAPGSYASSCSGAVDPNYTFSYVAGTVTVSKATPTVSVWPAAGAITFGQTLASSTLGSGTASVGGTFGWTTSSTAPAAGTPSESVTFTPTSTTNYNTVTGTISVTVHQAALTVTASSTTVSYGTAVPAITPTYSGWANGNTASSLTTAPTCSTTYTTTSALGSYASSCSGAVDPNYTFSYVAGTVTVSKATPTVSVWPTATPITYLQTLASSTLSGGTASVSGTFVWTTPSTSPSAGTPSESVTFMPTNTTDYATISGSVSITVHQVVPTIHITSSGTATTYYGTPVTFTATVTTGDMNTVTFLSNGTVIGTANPNALGIATLTDSTLAVGTNSITASIAASGNYAAATSAPVAQCLRSSTYWVQYRAFIPADHLKTAVPCYIGQRLASPEFVIVNYVPILIPGKGWIMVLGDADNPSLPNTTQFRIKQYANLAFSSTGPAPEGAVVPVMSTSYNFSSWNSPVNGSTISTGDFNGGNNTFCDTEQATGHADMTDEVGTASSTGAYQASVNFCCAASDPLFASPVYPIQYNLNVSIDETTSPPTATITGTHTCFPSHEIAIGTQVVYQKNPDYISFAWLSYCLISAGVGLPETNVSCTVKLDGVSRCTN